MKPTVIERWIVILQVSISFRQWYFFWKKIKTSIMERNGTVKDVWACLDCCFKDKWWYILKVIVFLYVHMILTFDLIEVNVGGMEFIYISSYRAFLPLFLIWKKILKLLIHLQGKILVANTKNDTTCLQCLCHKVFLDYRVLGGFFLLFLVLYISFLVIFMPTLIFLLW